VSEGWKLGVARRNDKQREHGRRVRDMARAHFRLVENETLSVAEVECSLPGCPPIETVIVFWTREGAQRHHYKVFKPLAEVQVDDLPPWWMKDALAVSDEFECSCC
jgi:hypothetical protein